MCPQDELSVRIERAPEAVVHVAGELDMATAPRLDACLDTLGDEAVTLDLRDLTFIDSSGLAVLDRTRQRLASGGHALVLRNLRPETRRVFVVTGLESLYTMVDDPTE